MSDAKTKAADKVKEVKEKAASTKDAAKEKVASSAKVNVNKADAETLQKLSGIGEKKHKRSLITVTKWAKSKVLPSFQILMVSVKRQLRKSHHS